LKLYTGTGISGSSVATTVTKGKLRDRGACVRVLLVAQKLYSVVKAACADWVGMSASTSVPANTSVALAAVRRILEIQSQYSRAFVMIDSSGKRRYARAVRRHALP
jgi:hypothetical protein